MASRKLDLMLQNQSQLRMPRQFLQEWYVTVCAELRSELSARKIKFLHGELVVVFLDTKPAAKLNAQFRGKNYATDVLSFQSIEASGLGELVLCPQVVRRQAKEHCMSYRAELGYMVLHGILHLLGYDHEKSSAQAKRMFTLQDRVFARAAKKMRLDW